jgi:hypothetical protein
MKNRTERRIGNYNRQASDGQVGRYLILTLLTSETYTSFKFISELFVIAGN